MTRRARYLSALPFVLFASSFAHAKDIKPFDAYYKAQAVDLSAPMAGAPKGTVASVDALRQTPRFFWAQRGVPLPASLAGASSERIASHHLAVHAGLWGLTSASLKTARPVLVHDIGRGGIIVVFRQKLDGVEVSRSDMKVLMTRTGELVAISGSLHPAAVFGAHKKLPDFGVSSASAIAHALEDAYGVKVDATKIADTKKKKAGYGLFGLKSPVKVGAGEVVFNRPARIKKVYYPMPGTLVPAYYVELQSGAPGAADSDALGYTIAADDGRVLMRHDLKAYDSYQYRVWAEDAGDKLYADGPLADYNPHPAGTPDLSISGFAAPTLVSMEGFNSAPGGGVDPWLPAGATETKGNNVDAYTDHTDCAPNAGAPCTTAISQANDGFTEGTDIRATTTAPGVFDRVYDVNAGPLVSQDQSMAAITQLFYTNNWLHDYWYDSGFNEAAGNAQDDNFGRGGVEGDHLRAEAQDKALGPPISRNNANMSTPADGESPRMQMFVWTGQNDLTLDIGAPISASYQTSYAAFGAQNFDLNAELVVGDDGVPVTTNACEALQGDVTGKIVLVDRGVCPFTVKAVNVQAAGAAGMLIINNTANPPLITASGTAANVTIPILTTTLANGDALKAALANGPITIHMKRVSGADRDGTIDNNIISHEWGHYLHHRLVDCGLHQCRSMSEGWADFVATHQSMRAGDNFASGTWATGQYATVSFTDEGYYGIRRLPYSSDFAKNPFTFKHAADENTLPNIPMGFGGAENSEVHNAGEVWAQMLFDAYTGLLMEGGHTFDESKRLMADYIVAGMIMTPVEPTFTEQRDAILAATAAASMADMTILAQGFAGRGAGTCAVSPPVDTDNNNGIVESYELKGRHAVLSAKLDDATKSCDLDGILDGNEAGKVAVDITNGGPVALTNTTVNVFASDPGVIFPTGNQITVADLAPFETKTVTLDIALDDAFSAIELIDLTVTAENGGSCIASADLKAAIRSNADDLVAAATTDTVDSDKSTWSLTGMESDKIWTRVQDDQGNFLWHGLDFSGKTDTSLESADIMVAASGDFVFSFEHRHSFEVGPAVAGGPDVYWDGGLVEITEDGGMTWTDVSQFATPGYGGALTDISENPLALREAYVGESAGYPAMIPVSLDFGTAFAGKTVRLRFRIGTDLAAGAPGWDIDNMSVQSAMNTPFSAVIADDGECNGVPVAVAGPDQSVMEGDNVQLDASGSSDPESDPLTFTWTQKGGPAATLSDAAAANPTFTAPDVDTPTILTFEVMVSDGKGAASDTVDVVVASKNAGTGGAGGTGGMAGEGGTGGGAGGEAGSGGSPTGGTGGSTTGGAGGGGTGGDGDDGGCNCAVAGDDSAPLQTSSLGALAALVGLLFRRRRGSRKAS